MVFDDSEIAIAMHKSIFKFVTEIQDEVHRFSIEYQRKVAKKKSYSVTLEKIPGIGPKKAERLTRHFRTLANVRLASVEELSRVNGISRKDAQTVYDFFNNEEEQL